MRSIEILKRRGSRTISTFKGYVNGGKSVQQTEKCGKKIKSVGSQRSEKETISNI